MVELLVGRTKVVVMSLIVLGYIKRSSSIDREARVINMAGIAR